MCDVEGFRGGHEIILVSQDISEAFRPDLDQIHLVHFQANTSTSPKQASLPMNKSLIPRFSPHEELEQGREPGSNQARQVDLLHKVHSLQTRQYGLLKRTSS